MQHDQNRTVYVILNKGSGFTKKTYQNMKKSVLRYPRSRTYFCAIK